MTSRSRISAKVPFIDLLLSLSLPYSTTAHEGLQQHALFGVDIDTFTLTRHNRRAQASEREHHYKVMETAITGIFVQSKDALKTNPMVSIGVKPEQDFLWLYLML